MQPVEKFDSSVKGVIYVLHAGDSVVRYVGLAHNNEKNSPYKRFTKHRAVARRGVNRPVADWIRSIGEDNLHMTIIETFDENTIHLMGEREIFHIAQYETYFPLGKGGTNYTLGGENNAGAVRSKEFKENLRNIRTGSKHTEEAKTRMSMAQAGENNPMYGRTLSVDHRRKISEGSDRSRHTRWHTNRNLTKSDCTYCTTT